MKVIGKILSGKRCHMLNMKTPAPTVGTFLDCTNSKACNIESLQTPRFRTPNSSCTSAKAPSIRWAYLRNFLTHNSIHGASKDIGFQGAGHSLQTQNRVGHLWTLDSARPRHDSHDMSSWPNCILVLLTSGSYQSRNELRDSEAQLGC